MLMASSIFLQFSYKVYWSEQWVQRKLECKSYIIIEIPVQFYVISCVYYINVRVYDERSIINIITYRTIIYRNITDNLSISICTIIIVIIINIINVEWCGVWIVRKKHVHCDKTACAEEISFVQSISSGSSWWTLKTNATHHRLWRREAQKIESEVNNNRKIKVCVRKR